MREIKNSTAPYALGNQPTRRAGPMTVKTILTLMLVIPAAFLFMKKE